MFCDSAASCNEVSELLTLNLNGYDQKVLIDGKTSDLPLVIYLHGGPGSPIPFNAGCRGMFPEFTDHFIMVYWDQYGCGINNVPIEGVFGVETYVGMALDLVKELRSRFTTNPIYIYATSWGSVLSVEIALKTNELSGVVVWGQLITSPIYNQYALDALANSSIPADELVALASTHGEGIDSEHGLTFRDSQRFMAALQKYTDGYINDKGTPFPLSQVLLGLQNSPDYSQADIDALMNNGYTNSNAPFEALRGINMTETLRHIDIPYCILQGDTDVVTPTGAILELLSCIDNPHITCSVIKNAGHVPSMEGLDASLSALLALSAGEN